MIWLTDYWLGVKQQSLIHSVAVLPSRLKYICNILDTCPDNYLQGLFTPTAEKKRACFD